MPGRSWVNGKIPRKVLKDVGKSVFDNEGA
jgi:hypothetical protein